MCCSRLSGAGEVSGRPWIGQHRMVEYSISLPQFGRSRRRDFRGVHLTAHARDKIDYRRRQRRDKAQRDPAETSCPPRPETVAYRSPSDCKALLFRCEWADPSVDGVSDQVRRSTGEDIAAKRCVDVALLIGGVASDDFDISGFCGRSVSETRGRCSWIVIRRTAAKKEP